RETGLVLQELAVNAGRNQIQGLVPQPLIFGYPFIQIRVYRTSRVLPWGLARSRRRRRLDFLPEALLGGIEARAVGGFDGGAHFGLNFRPNLGAGASLVL